MYLKWDEKTITDFSDENINNLYNQGYVFTRQGKGDMYQTRSLRIDLNKFELSSENRRVLRKTEEIKLEAVPLPYASYDWTIGKMGKDFYDTKFGPPRRARSSGEAGDHIFSANKIKELMTDEKKSNFNTLFVYSIDAETIGYAICYQNPEILHYCYPFYELSNVGARYIVPLHEGAETAPLPPNLGLGMMLKAIVWAKEQNKKHVYLGSFSRPTDTYKLQFSGLEWWNGEKWEKNIEQLKTLQL